MTKSKLIGAVVAILIAGCGTDESPKADELKEGTGQTVTTVVSCEEIDQAVESVRDGLGSCTPNYKNQEPLTFSRAACDAGLETGCDEAGLEDARKYVDCLEAVAVCDPAHQATFDDAIDDCLDTFQNSAASEECIELVVGD